MITRRLGKGSNGNDENGIWQCNHVLPYISRSAERRGTVIDGACRILTPQNRWIGTADTLPIMPTERRLAGFTASIIYKSADSYAGCTEGWDVDDEPSIDEPVVDRWTDQASGPKRKKRPRLSGGFFSLSGGVMRDPSGAGNRIDYLLAKMLEQPDSLYVPNIDRNLDCLYTSLQLEMIDPHRNGRISPPEDDEMRPPKSKDIQ
jgi:hypothetical protein